MNQPGSKFPADTVRNQPQDDCENDGDTQGGEAESVGSQSEKQNFEAVENFSDL